MRNAFTAIEFREPGLDLGQTYYSLECFDDSVARIGCRHLLILAPIAADAASVTVSCEQRLAVAVIDPAGSRSVDLAVSLVGLESLDAASAQGFRSDHRHLPNELQKVGL